MDSIDTTNATTQPTPSTASSKPVKANPNFSTLMRLAPNITGMARKNVNSAATVRDVPSSIAPRMVAPERDVPGTRLSTWNRPMPSAVL